MQILGIHEQQRPLIILATTTGRITWLLINIQWRKLNLNIFAFLPCVPFQPSAFVLTILTPQ